MHELYAKIQSNARSLKIEQFTYLSITTLSSCNLQSVLFIGLKTPEQFLFGGVAGLESVLEGEVTLSNEEFSPPEVPATSLMISLTRFVGDDVSTESANSFGSSFTTTGRLRFGTSLLCREEKLCFIYKRKCVMCDGYINVFFEKNGFVYCKNSVQTHQIVNPWLEFTLLQYALNAVHLQELVDAWTQLIAVQHHAPYDISYVYSNS